MTKEWVKHKETILVLYKDQGKTLKEVMEIMEIRHGFKASSVSIPLDVVLYDIFCFIYFPPPL